MALQSSGAITLVNIQTEFGGVEPISINEYYSADTGVPASGQISMSDFYGKSAFQTPQGQAFMGHTRRDDFGLVLFTHNYTCTRTVNPTAGDPPSNIGYVQFDLPQNATAPDPTWTSYPAILGNEMHLVSQYSTFRINGTPYTGSWSTTTLQSDSGPDYVITYFSNTSAGAIMRNISEGTQLATHSWY